MPKTHKHHIEQLIRIAQENKKEVYNTDVSRDLNDAVRFALAMDIKDGKNRVLGVTVYEAYTMFTKTPLPMKEFFILFEQLYMSSAGKYELNYKPQELINAAAKMKPQHD